MRPMIDRYLFRQLLGPVVLTSAVLCLAALLTEALSSIGLILSQRQSAALFAKVVLLATPQMLVLVLPIALLVAGMVVLNRLHREHEIAVCFAAGVSRWSIISPAIRLATWVALLSLAINLWAQPACFRSMRTILEGVKTDFVGALVRPGRFTHPAPGVTIYAQSIDETGAIRNLFIDRRLPSGRDTTITAAEGRFRTANGAPILVVKHGVNEELSPDGALSRLSFDTYVLDLRPLLPRSPPLRYKPSDRYLRELAAPLESDDWERANRGLLIAEANARISAPLYDIAFMFLALAAILGGGFTRLGYAGRMATVSAVAVACRALGFAVQQVSAASPGLNALQYALPAAMIASGAWLLLRSGPEWVWGGSAQSPGPLAPRQLAA